MFMFLRSPRLSTPLPLALSALSLLLQVTAQSTSGTPSSGTPNQTSAQASASPTVSLVTSAVTSTAFSRSGSTSVPVSTTVLPTVFTVTVTPTSTSSASSNTTTTSATPSATPIALDTVIDPAFGVLGAVLIITGIPSAFLGHKNRWTSFFLIGFYTLSLTCWVLIVRFGLLSAINPPNKTIRGMFVLASMVAGIVGGGVSIFFWKASRYFIGGWGGLAFAWFIECFRDGGLIDPIGIRWLMYIACGVVGFTLCTIPRIHYHLVLISTAFVGATSFMLGVDCFTTAGLKEFYMWNLGFKALFPKFVNNGIRFPLSQAIQIELGLLGAVALMGIAVQLRILKILQRKLKEIAEDQRRRDAAEEGRAATRFTALEQEREDWEKEHPTPGKHGRNESALSAMPLMKDQESLEAPGTERSNSASAYDVPKRQRLPSGLSDYYQEAGGRRSQSPGAIPALDLGVDIEGDVPVDFLSSDMNASSTAAVSHEGAKKKQTLLAEIEDLRKSIEVLKDSPEASVASRSRHASMTSRRTLSNADLFNSAEASTSRPPSKMDSRSRTQSIEMSDLVRQYQAGETIARPTSAPLRDDDWDSYVHDRKLLQPPSGVTAPIPISRIQVPTAVTEALNQRRARESSYERGQVQQSSPSRLAPERTTSPFNELADARSPTREAGHQRSASGTPVNVLPSRKIASPQPQRPAEPRTRTFEELAERHKEKMREMQAPILEAEKEQANLSAAKARWERSKALEKEAVSKRQAERERHAARKSRDLDEGGRRSGTMEERGRHGRSLSAEKLSALQGTLPTLSKRASTMKVEDWQRYQHQVGSDATQPQGGSRSPTTVPFSGSNGPRANPASGAR